MDFQLGWCLADNYRNGDQRCLWLGKDFSFSIVVKLNAIRNVTLIIAELYRQNLCSKCPPLSLIQ